MTRLIGWPILACMNWPALLKRLKKRGWLQTQIAEHLGTSQSYISDLSRGDIADPRYTIAAALLAMDAARLMPPAAKVTEHAG